MKKSVLITGASGLLGRALVDRFLNGGFFVYGQYFSHRPDDALNCVWIQADFSSMEGIRNFLVENSLRFKNCCCLVNNYGPITHKNIALLSADDFYYDFHHNVITSFEITVFFLHHARLNAVINIGFEGVGEITPYKKILTYAAAKNTVQLMTESFNSKHPHIKLPIAAPPPLKASKIKPPPPHSTAPTAT
ncbi:MAG: SDR family oxidoreductase, partial [bacterium]|nr:SDR family oxidoreductase [bacterium]